jgi:hypothetical protein
MPVLGLSPLVVLVMSWTIIHGVVAARTGIMVTDEMRHGSVVRAVDGEVQELVLGESCAKMMLGVGCVWVSAGNFMGEKQCRIVCGSLYVGVNGFCFHIGRNVGGFQSMQMGDVMRDWSQPGAESR